MRHRDNTDSLRQLGPCSVSDVGLRLVGLAEKSACGTPSLLLSKGHPHGRCLVACLFALPQGR